MTGALRVDHRAPAALVLALAGAVMLSPPAWADHTNLEEGLPVEVTDAYPLEYLGREVQARFQYRYTAEKTHELYLEPRFELGLPKNGQLAVRVPIIETFVNGDSTLDLGRAAVEYMYNFNQETLTIPALSLAAGIEAPDTRDGGSVDPFARLLVSKMIPGSSYWHGVHLNGALQANVDRKAEERSFRYFAAVGYAFRLGATSIGVVDVVRDQPMRETAALTLGEIGFRVQVTPLLGVSFGGGAGASDDGDPVYRGTAAVQWFAF